MALFCVAWIRDSVFLLRVPFRSHLLVLSCEISPVCCFKTIQLFFFHFCSLVIVFLFVLMSLAPLLTAVVSLSLPIDAHWYHRHLHYYYYSLIRAFHISVSRWFFTGVWVTTSFLKSPGLFLVFWSFSIMLSFGWSPLVRQLPSPLVPLVII